MKILTHQDHTRRERLRQLQAGYNKVANFLMDDRKSDRYFLVIILLTAGIIFSLTSLPNHYYFRTTSFDAGYFTKAIYDYSNLDFNSFSVNPYSDMPNTLGDHFSPILILISPLRFLGGTWALLVFQILAILFGGVGVYTFIKDRSGQRWLPLLGMIHFFTIWGVFAALSFDYHNNVVGAMLMPWFLHYFLREDWVKAGVFFVLILMCKESLAIWMVFVCMGAGLLKWKDLQFMKQAGIAALVSGVWFVLCIKVLIPFFGGGAEGEGFVHFKYSVLGDGFGDMIKNALKDPLKTLQLLWQNHDPDKPKLMGTKKELHAVIFASGGLFLLYRPQFLLMLVPIYAMKLFHDSPFKWSLIKHYNIEFVPIITLAAFSVMLSFKKVWLSNFLALLTIVLSISATVYFFEHRQYFKYGNEMIQFYDRDHYKEEIPRKSLVEAIKQIPPEASVAAQSTLVPHLACRKKIYLFPDVRDAEYVALIDNNRTWPLPPHEHLDKLRCYWGSYRWENIFKDGRVYVFRRVKGGPNPCEHRNFRTKPQNRDEKAQ